MNAEERARLRELADGAKPVDGIRLAQGTLALLDKVDRLTEALEAAGHAAARALSERAERVEGNDRMHRALGQAKDRQLLALERALAEEKRRHAELPERIAQAIEKRRNEHWQQHLRDHPFADGRSCPGDYAAHDAYYDAAKIARALLSDTTTATGGSDD